MKIRIAQNGADCSSASEIFAQSWKVAYKGIFSEDYLRTIEPTRWKQKFCDVLKTQEYTLIIANDELHDVGAALFGVSHDRHAENRGEIVALYVLPEQWANGIGSALMVFMLDELSRLGCVQVHLWVARDNMRARQFYTSRGFSLTGKEDALDIDSAVGKTTLVEYENRPKQFN